MSVSERLIAAAVEARTRAVAPYSSFAVGAAVESVDGAIVTGCNIENASYGLTICAERVALFKAVSEGIRRFAHLVVAADTAEPTPPCGACRQVIWELCGDIPVTLVTLDGRRTTHTAGSLLPHPFGLRGGTAR